MGAASTATLLFPTPNMHSSAPLPSAADGISSRDVPSAAAAAAPELPGAAPLVAEADGAVTSAVAPEARPGAAPLAVVEGAGTVMSAVASEVRPDSAPTVVEAKTSWDLQHQPVGAGVPLDESYNVVCSIALFNARRYVDEAWCELILYQHQLIAMVGCLVIDRQHPAGRVRFFAPDPRTVKIPAAAATTTVKNTAPAVADVTEVEDMMQFRRLLDGAARVYCFNDHEFFGMLRGSLDDVLDLPSSCPWASHEAISQIGADNPLRPASDDPFADIMNAELPHPVPQRDEAEEITIPDVVIPPDPTWTPRNPPKEAAVGVPKETAGGGPAGASSYNTGDSQADVARYLASERWRSAKSVHKPTPPYLRDGEMIYWMFKCFCITADAEIEGASLLDMVGWNAHQSWWQATNPRLTAGGRKAKFFGTSDFARRHFRGTPPRLVGQMQYSSWAQNKRWSDVQASLEWELRSLADLATALYVHKVPVLAQVTKFNVRERRYEERWINATMNVCTPSVLQITHSKGESPPGHESSTEHHPPPAAPPTRQRPSFFGGAPRPSPYVSNNDKGPAPKSAQGAPPPKSTFAPSKSPLPTATAAAKAAQNTLARATFASKSDYDAKRNAGRGTAAP